MTAISQTLLRIFPPGTFPPNILKFDASAVPILQLGLSSKTLSEQELLDLGQNLIRLARRGMPKPAELVAVA